MSKTITVASKFTEEELDKIDACVKEHNSTRSAVMHDLVMQGIDDGYSVASFPSNAQEVTFIFLKDFAYFWKDRAYKGVVNGDDASVYFGGEWKHYKVDDLPVRIEY